MNMILDGPNGIGKSYACEQLVNSGEFKRIVHHTLPKVFNRILMMTSYKAKMVFCKDTVFDRSWYSEWVYGLLYRQKSVLSIKDIRSLDAFAIRRGIIVNIIVPINSFDAFSRMIDAHDKEKHPITPSYTEYDRICKLYDMCAQLSGKRTNNINVYVWQWLEDVKHGRS